MAKTFYINDFLRLVGAEILKDYYASINVSFDYDKNLNSENLIDFVLDHYKNLDDETQDRVTRDLREVNEMTAYAGEELLKTGAKRSKVKTPDNFEDYSQYDTALWFFMNEYSLFDKASTLFELQDAVGWRDVFVPQVSNAKAAKKRKVFEAALRQHLQDKELKGRYCIVEKYNKDGKLFFVAFPQDYAQADYHYSSATKLNDRVVRIPIFKIYFKYDSSIGMLSVKTKGGKEKAENYQKIFCKHVLDHEMSTEDQKIYDLNQIKDVNFSLPTGPEMEYVKIKSVTLLYYDKSLRLTLDLNDDSKLGLDDFHYRAKQLGIPLDFVNVVSAKFYFNFKPPKNRTKGSRSTVTAQVSFPNSHSFADKPLHNKARDYLQNWGITKKQDEEIATTYLEPPVSTGSDKDSN